jgi:hypothetical protein
MNETGTNNSGLYAQGRISIAADRLRDMGLDEATVELLSRQGLPCLTGEHSLLGLTFDEPFLLRLDIQGTVVAIARETWAPDLYVAISPRSGHVVAVSRNPGAGTTFINSSAGQFLAFLGHALEFFSRASKDADPPTTMTLAQARERLAALRRGDIRPKAAIMPFDRQKETARLRQVFKKADPAALVSETWWDRILEQIDDGQI